MGAVFLGGLLRWYLTRIKDADEAESRREKGVLFGSGLVGGGGLTGVALAFWVVFMKGGEPIQGYAPDIPDWTAAVLAAVTIGVILWTMAWQARRTD
jgi:hypothetical protein